MSLSQLFSAKKIESNVMLFKKEYALVLLSIAKGDIESAEMMAMDMSRGRRENICYFAQQCIKKCLKSILCSQNMPVPLSRTIELLLDHIPLNLRPPSCDLLLALTDYATARRYEEGSEIITDADIKAVIQVAYQTLSWSQKIVSDSMPNTKV